MTGSSNRAQRDPERVPEVILFDLGGVLVDFAGFRELRALLSEEIDEGTVKSRWSESAAIRDFEVGSIGPETFAERFVAEWTLDIPPSDFLREFETWPRGLYPGVVPLLAGARKRSRLAILSNTNETHWHRLRDIVAEHFDDIYLSFRLGVMKPAPAAYEAVLSGMKVAPSDVLFFDDSEANVAAARESGLEAELVRGVVQLRQCMRGEG